MSIGTILLIILVILLLGGFSGFGGGPFSGQLAAYGGIEVKPFARSEILVDWAYAPEFCYGCTGAQQIQLQPGTALERPIPPTAERERPSQPQGREPRSRRPAGVAREVPLPQ